MILLAVIYVIFISLGLPDSIFGASWPVIHAEMGIPQSFASVYSVIVGLCSGGSGMLAGRVLRRFGTPVVTVVSIFLTVVGMFGMSIAPNIWVMILFAIVLGWGAGAIDTGLNTYVSLHYKPWHMNWLHCFWGIGVTVSPAIMSYFLTGEEGLWRTGYRVIGLIQLAILLIALAAVPKWRKISGESPLAGKSHDDDAQEGKAKRPPLRQLPGATTSILTMAFYMCLEMIINTWGATYFVDIKGFSTDTAALLVSFYFGGMMTGRLISGFLTIKLSNKTLIRFGLLFSLAGMVLIALPAGVLSYAGMFVIGLCFGPVFPCIINSVPNRFGKTFSADIIGLHMGLGYLFSYVIQLIFGFIASNTTFYIFPFVLLVFCLLSFSMAQTTNRTLEKSGITS